MRYDSFFDTEDNKTLTANVEQPEPAKTENIAVNSQPEAILSAK